MSDRNVHFYIYFANIDYFTVKLVIEQHFTYCYKDMNFIFEW